MLLPAKGPDAEKALLLVLKSGGIAITPCDTIYGILGRAPDTEGRIREAKGREEGKPFIRLIATPERIKDFTDLPPNSRLLSLWPGPVTIIVASREGSTIALRCPADAFLRSILSQCGFPLFSTSVNKAGKAPLNEIKSILSEFSDNVDLILDGGDLRDGEASTIVDTTVNPYRILRQGALSVPEAYLL